MNYFKHHGSKRVEAMARASLMDAISPLELSADGSAPPAIKLADGALAGMELYFAKTFGIENGRFEFEPFTPTAFPTEYLSLGGIGFGVPVRATVSDFGPQLLGKVLESNETQEQSLGLVFRYADQKGLPLLDLSDLRALLTFLTSDDGKAELTGIGGLSSQTVGVCWVRSSGSRMVAGRSSSASRCSRSATSCARPRMVAGSSRASSCRPSRTSPSCSRQP